MVDIASHVGLVRVKVHVHITGQQAVFVANHGRPIDQAQVGDFRHGDLATAVRQRQQHPFERLQVFTVVAGIAHADPIPLAALHGGGLVVTPHRGHDHHVGVIDRQAVPGQAVAVEDEIQEVAPGDAFGIHTAGPRYRAHRGFHGHGHLLHDGQIRAGHLDAHGRPNAGGQHIQAPFDGHGPGVADAGQLQRGVQLGDQVRLGDAVAPEGPQQLLHPLGGPRGVPPGPYPPLAFGPQQDRGLHHGERGRVRGRVGATGFAEHPFDLGK